MGKEEVMTGKTVEFYSVPLITVRLKEEGLNYLPFGKKAGVDPGKKRRSVPALQGNASMVVRIVTGVNHGGT